MARLDRCSHAEGDLCVIDRNVGPPGVGVHLVPGIQ